MRVQVGPRSRPAAGLILAQLLHKAGIDAVMSEMHSPDYVFAAYSRRVSSNSSPSICSTLAGVGERMHAEGLAPQGLRPLDRRCPPAHRPARVDRRQAGHGGYGQTN